MIPQHLRPIVKNIAWWMVPAGFQKLIRQSWEAIRPFDKEMKAVLSANQTFKGKHNGQRCFILGTGPSINHQNLEPLKEEICISLNSFYVHKDYSTIAPRYHVVAGLALHPSISSHLGFQWFREMETKIVGTIFLNYLDRRYVLKNTLFKSKEIRYLLFNLHWEEVMKKGIDAARKLYHSQSVSVMAIQLALYMGFKEIYLLGLDHDWLLRSKEKLPTHFYQPQESLLERNGLSDWDNLDYEIEFWTYWNLWRQYKMIKKYAESLDICIRNSTTGGLLDVFPRIELGSILNGNPKI